MLIHLTIKKTLQRTNGFFFPFYLFIFLNQHLLQTHFVLCGQTKSCHNLMCLLYVHKSKISKCKVLWFWKCFWSCSRLHLVVSWSYDNFKKLLEEFETCYSKHKNTVNKCLIFDYLQKNNKKILHTLIKSFYKHFL